MARRYFRRYRRGRRYSRKRYPRKRYVRGVDRNTFCITKTENITYTFDSNQVFGFPNKFINFGVRRLNSEHDATSILETDKFDKIRVLYDQVRLKGMSVKISYVAETGLSAQTLNLYTAVDRSTNLNEMANLTDAMTTSSTTQTNYLNKIDNAASKRKSSLTGGKTIYFYFKPSSIQEKMFLSIDADAYATTGPVQYLPATYHVSFDNFNPCIYSYMEKSAAVANSPTSVILNVEIRYYVEFRSSI